MIDRCYPITKDQQKMLWFKWTQLDHKTRNSFLSFRRTVQSTFHLDDAVTVRWTGMWLCIETNGYCHS